MFSNSSLPRFDGASLIILISFMIPSATVDCKFLFSQTQHFTYPVFTQTAKPGWSRIHPAVSSWTLYNTFHIIPKLFTLDIFAKPISSLNFKNRSFTLFLVFLNISVPLCFLILQRFLNLALMASEVCGGNSGFHKLDWENKIENVD